MYTITIKECKQGQESEIISERTGFRSERAAKMAQKKLENVYINGRFTFYIFDIKKVGDKGKEL